MSMRKLIAAAALLAALAAPALAQTPAATTNGSVVITVGNTFQTVLNVVTISAPRRSLTIENNNATDSCWISFGNGVTAANATKAKSILLLPGGSYQRYEAYMPADEIEATCTTTNDTLYVDTQ